MSTHPTLFDHKPATLPDDDPNVVEWVRITGSRRAASLLLRVGSWLAFEVEGFDDAVGALFDRGLVSPSGSGGRALSATPAGLRALFMGPAGGRALAREIPDSALRSPRVNACRVSRVQSAARLVLAVLEEARGPVGCSEIREALERGGYPIAGAVVRDALDVLEATSQVFREGRGRGLRFRASTDVRSV